MEPRHLPNLISLLRILLVVPSLWLLLRQRYDATLALVVVAALSDGLDGFLARRYGWSSRLGGILDPLADKLLLIGLFLVLGWLGELPWWLVLLALGRDLLIMGGALAYHLLIAPLQAQPLLISKCNTLLQMLLVLSVLVHHALLPLPPALRVALELATAVTLVWSGAAYVILWGRRALIIAGGRERHDER
ncbi:MAG TPA: CDP-alcohol phosphatidyltransferase family protein [Candidatus Competibacteraceae bacterium]|nr:CDP-alcohol phosphatidyltransferase family protein [Candidatus Competibacteraceae bacterium]